MHDRTSFSLRDPESTHGDPAASVMHGQLLPREVAGGGEVLVHEGFIELDLAPEHAQQAVGADEADELDPAAPRQPLRDPERGIGQARSEALWARIGAAARA